MNKEQAKTILSVKAEISRIFANFELARAHFEDICEHVISKWVEPGATIPELYVNHEDAELSFDSDYKIYGQVFIPPPATIKIKVGEKQYLVSLADAVNKGLATEILP